MSRVFVISDTHFGHKRIIEFEKDARPFATVSSHLTVSVRAAQHADIRRLEYMRLHSGH
jgi:calcineurin-like phosphoesterase family protein